jgi:hypothetical protein
LIRHGKNKLRKSKEALLFARLLSIIFFLLPGLYSSCRFTVTLKRFFLLFFITGNKTP